MMVRTAAKRSARHAWVHAGVVEEAAGVEGGGGHDLGGGHLLHLLEGLLPAGLLQGALPAVPVVGRHLQQSSNCLHEESYY